MSFAVWAHIEGCTPKFANLPYKAQSPITGKKKEFKTKEDILKEIKTLVNLPSTKKYGLGQTMFLNIPFFCNPYFIIKDWHIEMLNDYNISKKFNVPIGNNLDDLNSFQVDCFILIENEMNNIKNYKAKKDG